MIIETTGKYKEVCIPYRQKDFKPYKDCYGVYKYAKRVRDDYVELSQTSDFDDNNYDKSFKRTIMRHRWVYQNEVGELSPQILIHHINHVKGDDRPENLEPTSRSKHRKIHNKAIFTEYNQMKNGYSRK